MKVRALLFGVLAAYNLVSAVFKILVGSQRNCKPYVFHIFDILQESLQTAATGKETELKTQLSDLMSSLKSVKEKLNLSEVSHKLTCCNSHQFFCEMCIFLSNTYSI